MIDVAAALVAALKDVGGFIEGLNKGEIQIGPIMIMGTRRLAKHEVRAFELGREWGHEHGPPPPVAPVLHLRRVES